MSEWITKGYAGPTALISALRAQFSISPDVGGMLPEFPAVAPLLFSNNGTAVFSAVVKPSVVTPNGIDEVSPEFVTMVGQGSRF